MDRKKRDFLPKKSYEINKEQQKRKRDNYYFLNYYYYNVQNAKTKDKKLCLHFNFYINSLSFRAHWRISFGLLFSFLPHPHALRFPPPKRPSARTLAHTHRHQARMRARPSSFSHSALVFLLGFAARIVVLVLCLYTLFWWGFWVVLVLCMYACFFWVFCVVVLQLQMKLCCCSCFSSNSDKWQWPRERERDRQRQSPRQRDTERWARDQIGTWKQVLNGRREWELEKRGRDIQDLGERTSLGLRELSFSVF